MGLRRTSTGLAGSWFRVVHLSVDADRSRITESGEFLVVTGLFTDSFDCLLCLFLPKPYFSVMWVWYSLLFAADCWCVVNIQVMWALISDKTPQTF